MRFIFVVPLLFSTGIACLVSREPVAQPVPAHIGRSLRQHHVIRATSDVCAHLTSSQLQTAATSLGYIITSGLLDIFNNLNFCICSSQLPLTEDLGLEMDLLTLLIGTTATNSILETAVSEVGTTCTYPSHATAAPVCTTTGFTCGFTCTSPYTESDDQCVCPSPYTTCNGVCGSFPKGCSSSTPQRRTVYDGTKRVTARGRSLSMADAQATCQKGEIVCGVYGGSSVYECVNTDMTLESCGACTIPNPFLDGVNASNATGVDCSAIPGVSHVQCLAGQCVVSSCASGWAVNDAQDGCAQVRTRVSDAFGS